MRLYLSLGRPATGIPAAKPHRDLRLPRYNSILKEILIDAGSRKAASPYYGTLSGRSVMEL